MCVVFFMKLFVWYEFFFGSCICIFMFGMEVVYIDGILVVLILVD